MNTMSSLVHRAHPFHIATFPLGNHEDNKRVWLHNEYVKRARFVKGTMASVLCDEDNQKIKILRDPHGKKTISGRPNGMTIVDIKNKLVAKTLGTHVSEITVKFYEDFIEVSVSAAERRKAERRAKTNNKTVEIFSGGGTLSTFAEMAGFKMDTVVERDQRFLDVFDKNINARTTICADVNSVDVADLPKDAAFLQFGYPCTTYSPANVGLASKQKTTETSEQAKAERRTADYLALALLDIIKHVNPRAILIEEVGAFTESVPYDILMYSLQKMDYQVSVTTVTGSFTKRKRVAIVAIADEEAISLDNIQYQAPRPISAHLDTPVCERDFIHISERPRESGAQRKGLGIRSQLPHETKVNTITTHWTRHNHVSLESPSLPQHYSDFTVNEVRKMHGLPEGFDCGDKVTTARAVLGQGVVDGFLDVLRRIHQRVCTPIAKHAKQSEFGQMSLC